MQQALRHILICTFILFCSLVASGQDKCSILGYVHEFIANPLGAEINAPVTLYDAILITPDDTLKTTSKNGDFQFRNLNPGTYTLRIEKEDYIPFEDRITLSEGDQAVTIELFRKGEELERSIVIATQPVMTMKGDTIVFHANAVRRMQGDFAIDLIAQMPGAEISDFGIKIGGKAISRAYVNGVLVFGRDPMDAMKNLAAEEVITMDIYDESPLITISPDDMQKERVVNIHTKNPIIDVTDIQSLFSGGMDKERDVYDDLQKRHLAGFSGNFFSESLQIKTDVLANNIGVEQSITLGADAFSTPASALTSQAVKNSARINLEKYWGRNYNTRTGMMLEYRYSDISDRSPQRSITEQFKTESTPARRVDESTDLLSSTRSHDLSSGFQKTFGSVRLSWTNRIALQKNSSETNAEREIMVLGDSYQENSMRVTGTDSWKMDEKLTLRVRTKSNDQNYSLVFTFGSDKGNSSDLIVDTLKSSASRRYLDISGDKRNWNAGAELSYTMRLDKAKHQDQIRFELSSEYRSDNKKQLSYDLLSGTSSIDGFNTYDYTYNAISNKTGFTYSRLFFQGGLSLLHSYLKDTERLPADAQSVAKSYYSLIPYIYIFNGRTLNIQMRSNVQVPSLEQVRKRINNTNPYSVIAGNPEIRPGQSYSLDISKNGEGLNLRNIRAGITYTDHPIVRKEKMFLSSTILPEYGGYEMPEGSMLHFYDNADWALSVNARFFDTKGVSMFNSRPISLRYTVEANAVINPAYMMDQLYRNIDASATAKMDMNYTFNEKLRVSVNGGSTFLRSSSTISDKRIDAISWNYGISVMYNPCQYAFVESSFNNDSRLIIGNEKTWANNFLKVSIGTKLLGQKLSILAEGIDLLDNSSVYSSTFSENAFTQNFKPVFGQYFLLSIKYRFNSTQNRFFMSSFNGSQRLSP